LQGDTAIAVPLRGPDCSSQRGQQHRALSGSTREE